jgi:hypothetical protein
MNWQRKIEVRGTTPLAHENAIGLTLPLRQDWNSFFKRSLEAFVHTRGAGWTDLR